MTYAKQLENDLFKLYLANCVHNRKSDKAKEFFEHLTPRLHAIEAWREWFGKLCQSLCFFPIENCLRVQFLAMPYLANPQEQPLFRQYFSKPWQETFLISLHNFLSLAFHQMQVPSLLSYAIGQSHENRPTTATHSRTQVCSVIITTRSCKIGACTETFRFLRVC